MSTEERVRLLRSAEPNSWLAFSHDEERVVASGATIPEVTKKAEEAGEPDPILTKIPATWAPMVGCMGWPMTAEMKIKQVAKRYSVPVSCITPEILEMDAKRERVTGRAMSRLKHTQDVLRNMAFDKLMRKSIKAHIEASIR